MPESPQAGEALALRVQAMLQNPLARHVDPAGLHYLSVLAQRMDCAPVGVRTLLEGRLNMALASYVERLAQAQAAAATELAELCGQYPNLTAPLQQLFATGDFRAMRRLAVQAAFSQPCAPLAQLNQHVLQLKQAHAAGAEEKSGLLGELESRSEMASVRRFRASWSRMAAENSVDQYVERGPTQAGPLNSHMLMLRSLALMRKLSPDYLQRFLLQMETLLWLDQVNQKLAPGKAKPTSRNRPRK